MYRLGASWPAYLKSIGIWSLDKVTWDDKKLINQVVLFTCARKLAESESQFRPIVLSPVHTARPDSTQLNWQLS